MHGLSAGTKKSGRCRELTVEEVRGGSTVTYYGVSRYVVPTINIAIASTSGIKHIHNQQSSDTL